MVDKFFFVKIETMKYRITSQNVFIRLKKRGNDEIGV